ncbi:delta-aminolevulinic acid dehydratase [Paenibacillus sp. CN-4]|uniref:delta-aminolevulinic acid dehydratase n=1 Tax=Paenibacillus nanchangensis TaxID=3348343 RepID=UPI0039798C92
MTSPPRNIALVCGPDCELETQALRAALEYFGARTVTYYIGRPNDLTAVLSGEALYGKTDLFILCVHGEDGRLLLPELAEDVYEPGEPKGAFGADEVRRYARLDGAAVIANGCTLGDPRLAAAFMEAGCGAYIGPADYPDGSSALLFLIQLLYEVIGQGRELEEALGIAAARDSSLSMYRFYRR